MMKNFEIRKYKNNISGVYFIKRNIEFFIDSEDEEILKNYNWSCKKNNTSTAIYRNNPDKSHVYFHRSIVEAQSNEKVYFVTDNIYDLRKSNLFKAANNASKLEIHSTLKKMENLIIPLNTVQLVSNNNQWELIKTTSNEPYVLLCNNETNQFYKIQGSLSDEDIEMLTLALSN